MKLVPDLYASEEASSVFLTEARDARSDTLAHFREVCLVNTERGDCSKSTCVSTVPGSRTLEMLTLVGVVQRNLIPCVVDGSAGWAAILTRRI